MRLISADLFRHFAIGFVLGAAGLVATLGSEAQAAIINHLLP